MPVPENIRQLVERGRDCYRRTKVTGRLDRLNPADEAMHDKLVSLAERMLELHKQSAVVRSPLDKERVGREMESTDKSIDRLVYELYGLSEDEIRIVEGE